MGWYWWYGPASVSCFLDLLRLDIGSEIELRARAYMATAQSACLWWPHRDFVCVSERPHTLQMQAGRLILAEWDGFRVAP